MANREDVRLVLDTPRRIEGLPPLEVVAALDGETVLIDVREENARQVAIPGGVPIPAHVLLSLADPSGQIEGRFARGVGPHLEHGRRLVVYCNDGDLSATTAACLFELGYEQATYLVGGLAAWIADGLDVEPPTPAGFDTTTNEREQES